MAPLVQLSRNLANIAEAADRQTGTVPVFGGLVRLLANALSDSTSLIDAVGTTRVGAINDARLGTVDRLLKNLVTGVLPIEKYAPAEITSALQLPPAFISSGLIVVTREVSYRLDQILAPVLSPLSQLVSSLFGALGLGRYGALL